MVTTGVAVPPYRDSRAIAVERLRSAGVGPSRIEVSLPTLSCVSYFSKVHHS